MRSGSRGGSSGSRPWRPEETRGSNRSSSNVTEIAGKEVPLPAVPSESVRFRLPLWAREKDGAGSSCQLGQAQPQGSEFPPTVRGPTQLHRKSLLPVCGREACRSCRKLLVLVEGLSILTAACQQARMPCPSEREKALICLVEGRVSLHRLMDTGRWQAA